MTYFLGNMLQDCYKTLKECERNFSCFVGNWEVIEKTEVQKCILVKHEVGK